MVGTRNTQDHEIIMADEKIIAQWACPMCADGESFRILGNEKTPDVVFFQCINCNHESPTFALDKRLDREENWIN